MLPLAKPRVSRAGTLAVAGCLAILAGCDAGRTIPSGSPRAGCTSDCPDTGPRPDSGRAATPDSGGLPPLDGGGAADSGGPPGDAGPCAYPPSQGHSQPCCPSLGIDACGASLFCAAFDGRTQPTCYSEGSRQPGDTCNGERQCSQGVCAPGLNRCQPTVNQACTADLGCAQGTDGHFIACNPSTHRCADVGTCDLVTGMPCTADQGCDLNLMATPRVAMCRAAGTAAPGDACTAAAQCRRGSTCVTGLNQCVAFCAVGVANACPANQTCMSLQNGAGICFPH